MKYVTLLCCVGYVSLSFFPALSMNLQSEQSDERIDMVNACIMSSTNLTDFIESKTGLNLRKIAHDVDKLSNEEKAKIANSVQAMYHYIQVILEQEDPGLLEQNHGTLEEIYTTLGFTQGKEISAQDVAQHLDATNPNLRVLIDLEKSKNPCRDVSKAIGAMMRHHLDNEISFFGVLFAHYTATNQLIIAPAPRTSSSGKAFGTNEMDLIISGLNLIDRAILKVANDPNTSPEAKACLKKSHIVIGLLIGFVGLASIGMTYYIGAATAMNQSNCTNSTGY